MFSKLVFRVYSYILYYLKSKKNLYIHSPFIFEWYNAVKSQANLSDPRIQNYRNQLKSDKRPFTYNSFQKDISTTISNRYNQTSINEKYGKLLTATSDYLGVEHFLELGTSLGVSTAYLSATPISRKGTSIDFNPQASAIANSLFDRYFPTQTIHFITSSFDIALDKILTKNTSYDLVFVDGDHSYSATIANTLRLIPYLSATAVIILDDIRWSSSMFRAWEELKMHSSFNYAIDFGRMGLLFKVNNTSPKQNFVLR